MGDKEGGETTSEDTAKKLLQKLHVAAAKRKERRSLGKGEIQWFLYFLRPPLGA